MRILNAEKDVYLFDDDDPVLELQMVACIGANLDVAVYRDVTEEKWAAALVRLEADDVTVIDCRKVVAGP
jgi:hypothetical protein